jgi:hypothetical protein
MYCYSGYEGGHVSTSGAFVGACLRSSPIVNFGRCEDASFVPALIWLSYTFCAAELLRLAVAVFRFVGIFALLLALSVTITISAPETYLEHCVRPACAAYASILIKM